MRLGSQKETGRGNEVDSRMANGHPAGIQGGAGGDGFPSVHVDQLNTPSAALPP